MYYTNLTLFSKIPMYKNKDNITNYQLNNYLYEFCFLKTISKKLIGYYEMGLS